MLPSGKWRAVLSAGCVPGGKRRRLTYTAETKREALAWLRERQAEQRRGGLADAGKMTLGEWLAKWISAKKVELSGATWHSYRSFTERLLIPLLGHIRLAELRPVHVMDWHRVLAEQGESSCVQRQAAIYLRRSLSAAEACGLIGSNPARRVNKPKHIQKEIQPFTAGQARAFLAAAAGDRMIAYYDLSLDIGLRPGEAFALHWPDLEGDRIFIHLSLEDVNGKLTLKKPKTPGSIRRVKLAPRTVASLAAHRERMAAEGKDTINGLIFPARRGQFTRRPNLTKHSFRPILDRIGVSRRSLYTLRHTSATLLLHAGVDIKTVSRRLGHKDIQTTLRHYIHCLCDQEEAARNAVERIYGDCPTGVPQNDEQVSTVESKPNGE
jgi:integrase